MIRYRLYLIISTFEPLRLAVRLLTDDIAVMLSAPTSLYKNADIGTVKCCAKCRIGDDRINSTGLGVGYDHIDSPRHGSGIQVRGFRGCRCGGQTSRTLNVGRDDELDRGYGPTRDIDTALGTCSASGRKRIGAIGQGKSGGNATDNHLECFGTVRISKRSRETQIDDAIVIGIHCAGTATGDSVEDNLVDKVVIITPAGALKIIWLN